MKNKVFAILMLFVLMVMFNTSFVSAEKVGVPASGDGWNHTKPVTSNNSFLDGIFNSAGQFFNQAAQNGDAFGNELNNQIFKGGINLIQIAQIAGNFIIIVVTIILGIKYIFSGIEGKSIVKESLPSLIIGVIFFYLAQNIVDFIQTIMIGSSNNGMLQSTTNFNGFLSDFWATFTVIVQMLSIAGLIFVGLKYMWSPAYKKAELKNQAIMIVFGLLLVFSTVPFFKLVVQIGNEALK